MRPFQTPKHLLQESSRTLQILILREKPNWEHVRVTRTRLKQRMKEGSGTEGQKNLIIH